MYNILGPTSDWEVMPKAINAKDIVAVAKKVVEAFKTTKKQQSEQLQFDEDDKRKIEVIISAVAKNSVLITIDHLATPLNDHLAIQIQKGVNDLGLTAQAVVTPRMTTTNNEQVTNLRDFFWRLGASK